MRLSPLPFLTTVLWSFLTPLSLKILEPSRINRISSFPYSKKKTYGETAWDITIVSNRRALAAPSTSPLRCKTNGRLNSMAIWTCRRKASIWTLQGTQLRWLVFKPVSPTATVFSHFRKCRNWVSTRVLYRWTLLGCTPKVKTTLLHVARLA